MNDFMSLISLLKTSVKYLELKQEYFKDIPERANLKYFLEQRDQLSIFLSIYHIRKLRKDISSEFLLYELSFRNILNIFEQPSNHFLTSDDLTKINVSELFENELRIILKTLKSLIFTIEISTSNKEELVSIALDITYLNRWLIPNMSSVFNLLISYKAVVTRLQIICSCIDSLHSNIKDNDWKNTITFSFEVIKNIIENKYLLFVDSIFEYIKRYIHLINLPSLSEIEVLKLLDSLRFNTDYPMATVIAMEMNQLIPDYYEGHRMNLILADSGSQIANSILDRYSHWFCSAELDYNNTHMGAFPPFDTKLLVFFKYLLENYASFLSLYLSSRFTTATRLSSFDSFSSRIDEISQLPPEVQGAILEILIAVKMEQNEIMNYFFDKININLQYSKISDEWSDNFQEKACKQPFKEVLLEFKVSELNLEQLLNKVTPKIYLIGLPKSIQGLTTNSQRIFLNYYKGPQYSQALTFIAYLHELAYYLLRTDPHLTTFGDANSINYDRFVANDAGLQLEENLFGTFLGLLTGEALEFVYNQQDLNREEFKSRFEKINVPRLGVESRYFRTKSSQFYVLGRCGCAYGRYKNRK